MQSKFWAATGYKRALCPEAVVIAMALFTLRTAHAQPTTFFVAGTNEVSGPVITRSGFIGDGTSLTNLNASELRTGTVPGARLTGTGLTNVYISVGTGRIASGTYFFSESDSITQIKSDKIRLLANYGSRLGFRDRASFTAGPGMNDFMLGPGDGVTNTMRLGFWGGQLVNFYPTNSIPFIEGVTGAVPKLRFISGYNRGAQTESIGSLSISNGGLGLFSSPTIPTNWIVPSTAGETNWQLVNLAGKPTLIATNATDGGWLSRELYPGLPVTMTNVSIQFNVVDDLWDVQWSFNFGPGLYMVTPFITATNSIWNGGGTFTFVVGDTVGDTGYGPISVYSSANLMEPNMMPELARPMCWRLLSGRSLRVGLTVDNSAGGTTAGIFEFSVVKLR